MKNNLASFVAVAALATTGVAYAQADVSLPYTFVDLAYVSVDDGGLDGFGVAGSFAVGEHGFVAASYSRLTGDWGVGGRTTSIGAGGRFPIAPMADFVAEAGWLNARQEMWWGGNDENGFYFQGGIRAMVAPTFEVNLAVTFAHVGESDTSFGAGFVYYMAPNFGIGAGASTSDGISAWTAGLRIAF